jgi:hypothetical protein
MLVLRRSEVRISSADVKKEGRRRWPSDDFADFILEAEHVVQRDTFGGFGIATADGLKHKGLFVAKAQLGLSARHEQGLRKNNRAENSHLPVRRRERKMQRFKSPGSAQWFLSVHAIVQNTFNVHRHLVSRNTLRVLRGEALQNWRAATSA